MKQLCHCGRDPQSPANGSAFNKAMIIYFLMTVVFLLGTASCGDRDEVLNPDDFAVPTIRFAYDNNLLADLNKIDNLPVVAVVTTEAGLSNVSMQIETGDAVIDYKTVSQFFNNKSYSLAENLTYEDNYKAFIVKAVDIFGREITARLPFNIIELKAIPQIIFDPETIVFDEMVGGTMPQTSFTVTTNAGLKKLEMFTVKSSGQIPFGYPIDFSNNEQSYQFSQQIDYVEGDRGFKVVATDIYGQVSAEVMPVRYIAIPSPVISLTDETIFADKDQAKNVNFHIEAAGGLNTIKVYRKEGSASTLVTTIYKSGENAVDISQPVSFTNATSGVKVEVTDNLGKTSSDSCKAIVNLRYVTGLSIGSQILANGHTARPDVYALLSLNDFKTYSVDYALDPNNTNGANVDIKFYAYGSGGVLRFYSVYGASATATKNNEYIGTLGNAASIIIQNQTKMLKVAGFDFDNATAATIAAIPASNIVNDNINPMIVGDVIAFKTAATSTAGDGKVGVIKILSDEQVVSNNATARVIKVSIKMLKE